MGDRRRRQPAPGLPGTLRTWFLFATVAVLIAGCRHGSSPGAGAPGGAASTPIQFEDATSRAGLSFVHFTGADGRFRMPESVGHGAAFLDYDGDGWLDVFVVNSSNWPDQPASGRTCALYRNQHDGTFRDVTREAGLAVPMYGMGCAVGDYDGDGREDILVTCLGPNHLFRNLGGRFQDVTASSGLGGGPRWAWHTSAAWFDYDRDGRLDLFVGRYVSWSPEADVPCRAGSGKRTYCGPAQYAGDRSELYRNLGGGRFQDVSAATGIAALKGKALGVVPLDENGDGWPDLVVTNDQLPNFLWRNDHGRRFIESGMGAGVAVGETGAPRAGMGVDVGDIHNDGSLAYAVGNFSGEGLGLFERGTGLYTDTARSAGLIPASLRRLTFGLLFLDADRDGWLDLLTCNGHVDPEIAEKGAAVSFREPAQLFRGERGRFADVTATAGTALQQPIVGRGLAWGDYDNDGRPDLLVCENNGPVRLLHNVTPDHHHWIGIHLRGQPPNRDAYGAEVRVTAGGMTQRRWVHSGSSYLSQSDTRALFGLGDAARVDRLEVRWPDGRTTVREAPEIDRYLEIREEASSAGVPR